MSVVQTIGENGIQLPCAAEAIKRGYLYKMSSGNMTKTASVDDKPTGVACWDSTDADGDAKTMTAGDYWNFYPIGCGKIVEVAFLASQNLVAGVTKIYTSQTAETDGLAGTSSENSATAIGHYMGRKNVTTSTTAGTCYPVLLDVENAN